MIHSDAAFILALAVLAFTDGYILNNVMMFGPKTSALEDQELTTSLIVAAQPVTVAISASISNVIIRNI